MKKYLVLSAALAAFASPAFAQSSDRSMETNSELVDGARQSQEPGIGTMQSGRDSAIGGTNDSNLEMQRDVLRGAEDSVTPGMSGGAPSGSLDSGGTNTGDGTLSRK